jgi:hypothetical protein
MKSGTSLCLGDPSYERSALANFKPWQPIYDDDHESRKCIPVDGMTPDKLVELTVLIQTLADRHPRQSSDEYPTFEQVAKLMVAAAKEMRCDPFDIARGARSKKDSFVSRARFYVAYAIRQEFNCGAVTIGRMVGSHSPDCYLPSMDYQRRQGDLKWFDITVLARVADAVK